MKTVSPWEVRQFRRPSASLLRYTAMNERRNPVAMTLSARALPALRPPGLHALIRTGVFLGTLLLACSPLAAQPSLLEKGVPREGDIGTGEKQELRIAVQAGEYARVRVDQTGVDVAARLTGPSGETVAEADGPGGTAVPEVLSWIARQGGEHRLAISPRDPAAPRGSVRVTLEELRPAAGTDEARVQAERAFWEGRHWWARQDEESKRKALAAYQKAAPLWQAAGDRASEADTVNQIGACHQGFGETDAAVAAYEQALALARTAGDRQAEAESLNNLAVIYDDQLRDPRALDFFEKALALYEELGDRRAVSTTRLNLGLYWDRRSEPAKALDNLNRSLEIRREEKDRAGEARVLAEIAGIRREEEPDVALDLFAQAARAADEAGNRRVRAHVLRGMASLYLLQGEPQKALELFTESLDLFREVGDRLGEGLSLSSLGSTALHLGDTDLALEHYTQALSIHREVKNARAEAYTLRDIGWSYSLRGEPEVALEHYERALRLSQDARDEAGRAFALHGLGRTRLALGQAAQSVKDLEEALAVYGKIGRFALSEVSAMLELGRAWQALGEPERAAARFQQVLAFSRQKRIPIGEAVSQWALARQERDRGNLKGAAAAITEAIQIIESVRPKVASERLRVSFFASHRDYYEFYIDLLMRLHEREPGAGHLAEAFAASERARARALLDLLAEGRIDVRRGIPHELKQRETEIAHRLSQLQGRLLDNLSRQDGSQTAQLEEELRSAEEDRERLEWQLRKEHPRYAAVRSPSDLPMARIQELLDDRSALLEIAVGRERSFLFVVTRDGLAGFPLPPAAELGALVDSLRQALETGGRRLYGRYVETAQRLYQVLIAPAEPLLRDKPNLIVAADGPLLLLSFETLLTGPPSNAAGSGSGGGLYTGLPYLILDRSVTYIPSAGVLVELREPRAPAPPDAKIFLGFGDPEYGGRKPAAPDPSRTRGTLPDALPDRSLARSFRESGLLDLPPLPESRNEVTGIAGLYPPERVAVYLDRQASEENLKDNPALKTARRIHIAAHGLLNEQQPEFSGLVLTLDGDPKENGLLQTYEIFNLELSADLVVLSACGTALGKNVGGEGLIGVSRALLYAGAASVVVSLWPVADASTSDLMVRFYRHLDETGDRAEALRRSKLELIRGGRFAHPYHWAPFILIGMPR